MKDKSVITILYDFKNAGIGVFFVIIIIITFIDIRDDYLDKHDECRIYRHNLNASILDHEVVSVDPKELSVYIRFINDSTKYRLLDKSFIDSLEVGDVIRKLPGDNQVIIFRGEMNIKVQFAQKPKKVCK